MHVRLPLLLLLLFLVLRLAFAALLLPADPLRLVALACLVADRDPAHPDGTADVHAVAYVPGVLPAAAVQRRPSRSENLEPFGFVEHVLVERPPVDLAPGEDLLHERIELVGCLRGRLGRRVDGQEEKNACATQNGSDAMRAHGHGGLPAAGWPDCRRRPPLDGSPSGREAGAYSTRIEPVMRVSSVWLSSRALPAESTRPLASLRGLNRRASMSKATR